MDSSAALGSDAYARMPFAIEPMRTEADMMQQRAMVSRSRAPSSTEARLIPVCIQYIQLIEQDGTVGAMDELDDDE